MIRFREEEEELSLAGASGVVVSLVCVSTEMRPAVEEKSQTQRPAELASSPGAGGSKA